MTDTLNISQLIMAEPKRNLENHDDISSDEDDFEPPFLQTVTKEELRLVRIQKRAQKKAEKHSKAEVFKRMGDELYHREKFDEAYIPYLEATQIWPSNVDYYVRLAMTYSRLGWYEEAAHASTRALTLEPKNLEARYLRGVARLEQRLLRAAKTDLEIVTKYDAQHTRAADALKATLKALEAGTKLGTHTISHDTAPSDSEGAAVAAIPELDFSYPHYDDSALEVDTLSNTSDCNHRGNGVPCRFYNRTGCAKASLCPFSHAPDEKSVRDDLGRNVCTYFLLDNCKFGASKCVYSHSRTYLPTTHGWWNSEEATAKVKSILEMTERTMKERRSLAAQLQLLQRRKAAKEKKAKTPQTAKGKGSEGEKAKEVEEKPKEEAAKEEVKAGEKPKGKKQGKGRKDGNNGRSKSRPKKQGTPEGEVGKAAPPAADKQEEGVKPTEDSKSATAEEKVGLTTEYKLNDGEKRVEAKPDVILSY